MAVEYTIRVGNDDPEFREEESRPWRNGETFPTWDAARLALIEYFEDWAASHECPSCREQAAKVAELLRTVTRETWDTDEIWVDGDEYWIEPVPLNAWVEPVSLHVWPPS